MRLRLAVCLTALVLAAGCAPMFSDARMLRPGQVEITPAVNPAFLTEDGDTAHVWNDFGIRAQFGVTDRVNIGAGYNRTQLALDGPDSFGFNTVAFGPKFSLIPDRLAVGVPVGFSFGENVDEDRWQLHPTLLMTVPMNEHADFNPAVRLLIPTCDGCDTLIAFHAGFGVRTGRRLVLRPEAVFIFNPGEDGMIWTFGFGASIR